MTLFADTTLLFGALPANPAARTIDKHHGRLERREIRVSTDLVGYSLMPGLAQVAEIRTHTIMVKTGEVREQVRYLFTSLPAERASPKRLLALSRGHWGIENRLFHVKDDSFGEDRQVLQRTCSGAALSAFSSMAVTLLRGTSPLWNAKEPLTARSEYLNANPLAAFHSSGHS